MVGDLGDRVEDMGISVDFEMSSGQMAFCRRIEIPVSRHFFPPIFEESIKPDDIGCSLLHLTSTRTVQFHICNLKFLLLGYLLYHKLGAVQKVVLAQLISENTHGS